MEVAVEHGLVADEAGHSGLVGEGGVRGGAGGVEFGSALGVGELFPTLGDTDSALLGGFLELIDDRFVPFGFGMVGEVIVEALEGLSDEVLEISLGLGVGGVGGLVQHFEEGLVAVEIGLGFLELAGEFFDGGRVGVGG